MTKLNTILSQIEKLKASLSQINPAAEDVPNRYWQDKLLLSQLYEQAGDLYLANKEYLLAVSAYSHGYKIVPTNSLNRKLNHKFEGQLMPGEFRTVTTEDKEILYLLGIQYQSGIGVPINIEAAFYYYSLAANLGHADAQWVLGSMYLKGTPLLKSFSKLKADQIAHAQNDLGFGYHPVVSKVRQTLFHGLVKQLSKEMLLRKIVLVLFVKMMQRLLPGLKEALSRDTLQRKIILL